MRTIDADRVFLPPLALVEALREGHRGGPGEIGRLLVEAGSDGALVWAGFRPDLGLAIKTATVFPGNAAFGRPNIHSLVTLFDGATGVPLAVLHGESFTRMKTAADSALSADLLARPDADSLAVLGAGAQAETQIRFHIAVRPTIRCVRIWNRTTSSAEALARKLSREGILAEAVTDAEDAVRGSAIVSCLTAATTPVLGGAWLAPGTHVDLVGGYTPAMRESDDAVVTRGRLFADSLRFGVETCGDYAIPLAAGTITRNRIEGDLFDLCSGHVAGRRSADEITVCKNGGGGHLDLMAARALYEAATRADA